jgi:hypothetical protein
MGFTKTLPHLGGLGINRRIAMSHADNCKPEINKKLLLKWSNGYYYNILSIAENFEHCYQKAN